MLVLEFALMATPLALPVAWSVWGVHRWRRYVRENAGFAAGELARRLSLSLVRGEPEFNPLVHSHGKSRTADVCMQGAPHGVPLEFLYFFRVRKSFNGIELTQREWFRCHMAAQAVNPFPPFEVTTRQSQDGAIGLTQALPEWRTGQPAIDAVYRVATREPAMAAVLGEVLPVFSAFGASGVHLVGDGRVVTFVMQRFGSPTVAGVLPQAETLANGLTLLARRVGG